MHTRTLVQVTLQPALLCHGQDRHQIGSQLPAGRPRVVPRLLFLKRLIAELSKLIPVWTRTPQLWRDTSFRPSSFCNKVMKLWRVRTLCLTSISKVVRHRVEPIKPKTHHSVFHSKADSLTSRYFREDWRLTVWIRCRSWWIRCRSSDRQLWEECSLLQCHWEPLQRESLRHRC